MRGVLGDEDRQAGGSKGTDLTGQEEESGFILAQPEGTTGRLKKVLPAPGGRWAEQTVEAGAPDHSGSWCGGWGHVLMCFGDGTTRPSGKFEKG